MDWNRCRKPDCPCADYDSSEYMSCSARDCGSSLPRCPICKRHFVTSPHTVCEECRPVQCDGCLMTTTKVLTSNSGERLCTDCAVNNTGPFLGLNKLNTPYYSPGDPKRDSQIQAARTRRLSKFKMLPCREDDNDRAFKPVIEQTCAGCTRKFFIDLPAKEERFCKSCLVLLYSNTCVNCLRPAEEGYKVNDYGFGPCCSGGIYIPPVGPVEKQYEGTLIIKNICINCEEHYARNDESVLCANCEEKVIISNKY